MVGKPYSERNISGHFLESSCMICMSAPGYAFQSEIRNKHVSSSCTVFFSLLTVAYTFPLFLSTLSFCNVFLQSNDAERIIGRIEHLIQSSNIFQSLLNTFVLKEFPEFVAPSCSFVKSRSDRTHWQHKQTTLRDVGLKIVKPKAWFAFFRQLQQVSSSLSI